MATTKRYLPLAVAVLIPVLVSLAFEEGDTDPNDVQLICQVNPVTTALDNDSIVIPVILNNNVPDDSVAGFELWISSSDLSLVRYKILSTDSLIDSICLGHNQADQCTLWRYDTIEVSVAPFDTHGTLASGWEYVQARAWGSTGLIRVSGIANVQGGPTTPPIPQAAGVLVRLLAETNGALGDSICDSVTMKFTISPLTHFSNNAGNTIPCNFTTVIETSYANCYEESAGICLDWWDTLIDTLTPCLLDTSRVLFVNGDLSFECCNWVVGDANGNGFRNIADVVYLIQFIFAGGPAPVPVRQAGDANCNTLVNIADAVFLIQYIFGGGPAPQCTCNDLI